MKTELCAGVVAVNDDGHVGLIQATHRPTDWLLPKGHQENGEDLRETALREAMEEMGIGGVIEPKPPAIVSHYSKTDYPEATIEDEVTHTLTVIPAFTHIVCKVTYFYLMTVAEICEREDNRPIRWVKHAEALKMLSYSTHRIALRRLNW